MAGHKWMQSLRDTSVCPKCQKYSLQRSTVHNRFEDFRKRHSNARPYRCHACGWRRWLKENELIYPSTKELMELKKNDFPDDPFKPISLDYTFNPDEEIHHYTASHVSEQNLKLDETSISNHKNAEETETFNQETEQKTIKHQTEDDAKLDFIFPPERKFADQLTSSADRRHRGLGRSCPICGETGLHRSHSRGFIEYLKKKFSSKRPFRCNKCMWRGWLDKD